MKKHPAEPKPKRTAMHSPALKGKQTRKPAQQVILVYEGLATYESSLERITQNVEFIIEFPNSPDSPLARKCLADILERKIYVFETNPKECFAGIITDLYLEHYLILYPNLPKPEYRDIKDLRKVIVVRR